MAIAGFAAWYADHTVRGFSGTPTIEKVAGWPRSGVLCAMIYYDTDYAPEHPYRCIMMGTETYIYDPSAEWFDQTDEQKNNVLRSIYGNDVIVFDAQTIAGGDYDAAAMAAMDAYAIPPTPYLGTW